jgi:hypothetical protein
VIGGKPIAVLLQSITGVSAINPLVASYDIRGGKKEMLFFYYNNGCSYRKRAISSRQHLHGQESKKRKIYRIVHILVPYHKHTYLSLMIYL